MKKTGFTLIELLAVIVILAIIALIAIPVVISIVNDSKSSSEKESIKLYLDTVTKTIGRQNLKGKYEPDLCIITNTGDVTCKKNNEYMYVDGTNKVLKIEVKGLKPSEGIIYFINGKINKIKNLKVNDLYYQMKSGVINSGTKEKEYLCTKVSDFDDSGIITKGDKYTCKVKSDMTTPYTFYVLTEPTSTGEVNLIMDRNICNDGSVKYNSANTYCRYKWYGLTSDNTYGPITAMQELYAGTKDWDNVSDMIMNYTDENNGTATDMGYTSIITSNGVTTITGKPTTNTSTVGTASKPLKARLPKQSEVMGAGCTTSNGSCPAWLTNGLAQSSSYYSNNEHISGILGYWLLSSSPGSSTGARFVYCNGVVGYNSATNGLYGARPVITVSKSDLS